MAAKKKAGAKKKWTAGRSASKKGPAANGDGSQFEQTFKNMDDVLWKEAPTRGGFAPIQVGLTECVLSDIAENAVSFPYQRPGGFVSRGMRQP